MRLGEYIVEIQMQFGFNEIKNRRGKMINGVFVKEQDLKEVAE